LGPPSQATQNSKSAKQNAKRLHGVGQIILVLGEMNSPVVVCGNQSKTTMSRKKSNNNNNKVQQRPAGNKRSRKRRNVTNRMASLSMARPSPQAQPTLGGVGGQLGTIAGNFLSKIFGLGAYKMKQNSVFERMSNSQVPVMHSQSESIVFRHREYIADVSSSVSFASTVYSINPGLSSTFPFLSSIALSFQEYEFRGLVFEYKSTSADALNSTNTALGSVCLAAQYRADAPVFFDKQQLLNEMWSCDAKPSECFILPIECSPKENPLKVQYVRGGPLPANQDVKLFDLAKLTVATVGSQAAAVIGELWASYEVAFYKPQLSQGLALYADTAMYSTTGAVTASPFGTARVLANDTIGLTIANNLISFPLGSQGNYMLLCAYGGSAVTSSFTIPILTNCSFFTTSTSSYFGSTGTSSTFSDLYCFVTISDPTKVATIASSSNWVIPTSTTYALLFVTQINGSAVSY
jgi:hypothetical protein